MMSDEEDDVLGIIQSLEAQVDITPTWRMIYRRFAGDDFVLGEILAKLLEQGKIYYSVVNSNSVYRIKRKV